MPAAAIASAAGRTAAATTRSAVRVGTGAVKAAKKIVTSQENWGQRARTAEDQRRRLLQGQRQAQRARVRESETLGTMSGPMLTGAGQRPMDLGGGISSPGRPMRPQEQNGMQMSPETEQQRLIRVPPPLPAVPLIGASAAPGEATEEEIKKRETRETIIEYYLQAGNLVLTTIDISTLGAGLLLTWGPRMLFLSRWNLQMIVGDMIWKGKHKYIGGLQYRGGWSILKYLDSSAVGFKAMVIVMDLVLVLMTLVAFMMMFLLIIAALSPVIIASYLFGTLFGPT